MLARFELNHSPNKPSEVLELAEAVAHDDRIVILGDPGSGKTTLLRYLALKHAQALWQGQQEASKDLGQARFPIFVRVAEYAENGIWERQSLSNFLTEYHCLRECPSHELTDLLQSELNKGNCLILLDGLDEIVSSDERRGVVQRLEDFVRRYGNKANRFVITSRIVGYRSAPLGPPFSHYTVREMNKAQIRTFLECWCQAVEDAQTPELSFQERRNIAKREIAGIMRAVRTSSGVRRLAANPLLLRIIALIHRTGAQLPQKRIELYKLAADTLARTWRTAQGVRELALVADEYLTPMLSKLAYWLHIHKPTGIATEREAYDVLGEEWARLNDFYWDEDDPDPKIIEEVRTFLATVREHTGLFVERAPKRYGFMHLTFEDYYAARYLVTRSRTRAKLIRKHLHDPRWEEPILLALGFVGLESPEETGGLVETAILAEGEEADELGFTPSPYENLLGRDYLFALRCLGDNIPMHFKVQKRLTERLVDELEHWAGPAQFWKYRRALREKLRFLEGSKLTSVLLSYLSADLKNPPDHFYRHELAVTTFTGWSQVPYEVVSILLQALHNTNPKVRSRAAESLGRLKQVSPGMILALIQATHDEDSDVRLNAVTSLGPLEGVGGLGRRLGGLTELAPEIMAALLQALHDSNSSVRKIAAYNLAEPDQASPEMIAALVQVLNDESYQVRRWAAYSLPRLGKPSPEVETALLHLLHDNECLVRYEAATALGLLGYISTDVVSALLEVLNDKEDERLGVVSISKNMLVNIDLTSSEAVAILLDELNSSDVYQRQKAAQSLGSLGSLGKADAIVYTALITALYDSTPDVRQVAAQSLGRLCNTTPEMITALLQALYDDNLSVRLAVVVSLGRLGKATPEVVRALMEELHAHDLQERALAALSLGRLGQISEQICETLQEALHQIEGSKERSRSAYLLGKIGQSDEQTILQLLQGLIIPEFEIRAACSQALVQLGRRFPNTQTMIAKHFIQAIKEQMFEGKDKTKRSGHDHAYEGLWLLIIGGKIPEQEY